MMEEAHSDQRPSKRRKLSVEESTVVKGGDLNDDFAELNSATTTSQGDDGQRDRSDLKQAEVDTQDTEPSQAAVNDYLQDHPAIDDTQGLRMVEPTRNPPTDALGSRINESTELEAGDHSDSSAGSQDGHHSEASLPPPEETAPLLDSVPLNADATPISKTQQKKLRKKQEWESKRDERKLVRKEKLVAKRERKRAERNAAAEGDEEVAPAPPPPVQKPRMQKAVQLPVTIMIDCDFDYLMRDNERISLASQITRSYSDNKNSMFRAHLTLCSFGGKLRERFDTILTHYKSWKGVRSLDSDFVEASEKANEWMLDKNADHQLTGTFSKYANEDEDTLLQLKGRGEVVYLTSEAEETLTELKPYSTYIIGGLVDKNREKGICYKRARQRGIKTARLPISEFMDMQSRKVLATNHVNEIMLKWLECGDWGEAFIEVIPKRKGGKLKGTDAEEQPDDET